LTDAAAHVMSDDARRGAMDADQLDDASDRSELRNRYYGLLEELRVVVTGAQVLLAFLLTVPFSQGFDKLDDAARAWFGAALLSATLSVVAFITPTAMHRYGRRTARGSRLKLSIAAVRIGLVFLGGAVVSSFGVVAGFLYSGAVPMALTAVVGAAIVGAWLVVPLLTRLRDGDPEAGADDASHGPVRTPPN